MDSGHQEPSNDNPQTLNGQEPEEANSIQFAFDSLESVRKKLLDLTGRNQLLNYKHPKSSCVRIIDELPDQIYAELQSGKTFTFIPVPEPTEQQLIDQGYLRWDKNDQLVELKPFPNAERWASYLGFNTNYELPELNNEPDDKHQDLDIQTLMYATELETRLRTIRGKAETAIEESGSNILYIVLGFLEWYESRESDVKRLAPLFTLPVKLERTKLDQSQGVFRYAVSLKDEGLLSNITLREKLANDFDLSLPEIDDESTPEAYFNLIQNTLLKHEPRWKLHRMATLAILNFAKQVMYEDLDPTNWPEHKRIEDHPIVKQFFSSQTQEESTATGFVEEYPIDQIDNVHDHYPLIFEADSSQHSALIDAAKGESLVIEGPPGSGKSQTITNLIAACIANGKRVLFVAEKMAALEVVKHRLDKAGLGDFCLELHSHKTQKQRLLEDLKNRLDKQGKYPNPNDIDADIARFEDLKAKLNRYVEAINSTWKSTGLTIHDIFNRATRFREALALNPDQFSIDNVNGDSLTAVRRRELLDLGEMLKSIYRQIQEQAPGGDIANHYWYGVNNADLLGHQQDELATLLQAWTQKLEALLGECQSLSDTFAIPAEAVAELEQINQVAATACALPDLLGGEPLSLLPQVKDQSQTLNQLLDQYNALYGMLEQLETRLTPGAIKTAIAPTAIHQAVNQLRAFGVLVSKTLAELQQDLESITAADAKARTMADQLQRIRDNVPDKLTELTTGSVESLAELKTFIGLVAQLPADFWRHRDSVYDAPEMDDLLTHLTTRFNDLVPVHKELQEHFKLKELPAAQSVKELQDILCNAGFFCFLSKRWWVARKVFANLAISAKPNKKQLLGLLPKLTTYKQEIEGIDQLNRDNQVLADLYQGMDTPLERIVQLRQWYCAVRDAYGRGLGPKAKFAEAMFSLDRDLAMDLCDLVKDGFLDTVTQVLNVLDSMHQHYSNHEAINDKTTSLVTDLSPLSVLHGDLQKPLNNLAQCFSVDSLSLSDCSDVARKLQSYQEQVPQWQQHELIQLLAPATLPLEIAPGKRNAKALAVARNFSAIADACNNCDAVYAVISQDCGAEKYNKFKESAESLKTLLDKTQLTWQAFEELGKVNAAEWQQSSGGKLVPLIQRNHNALDNRIWLNNWLEYLRLRSKLTNEGMQKLLQAVESGELSTESLIDIVNMVLMHQLSKEILAENAFLAEFSGMEQMAIRERFCEYDKRLLELQRKKIAYRAAQKQAPAGNASGRVGTYTDVSLIQHEAGKKKGHVAVRALIERAGKAIQALKPCFMMSPMSVAQYIKPGEFEFDIVVMDEASQIRPEDALGSIARGTSLVVVGDPKQLPPTSFFDKLTDDGQDDDSVALQATESILETATPMFRTRRLRWHYRSRHESLIAFSNLHYYNSDLVIFPSPFASGTEFGIRYHKVQRGRFNRGKNSEEARAIAQAALTHMLERPFESIGLVAMNAEQRTEIEMHVEQLIKEEPQFKTAYDNNHISDESLFIKNLENVQGDERDVIMISMTYGPDEAGGKVYQRFGPINKDVGWRRLNVLFTRSKRRMHIFSSMDSHQIQVTERSKKGVQSLRRFLEYCESGHLASSEVTGRATDSDFETAVKDALLQKGYDCEPQLGVAGFYLDLAVKDPVYPGTYLLGIECDGATYHSAKSARDRDRLRQEILESLGWKIRRIWSTDWFKNPQAQLQPILNDLEKMTEGRIIPEAVDAEVPADIITPSEAVQEFEQELDADYDENVLSGDKSLRDILIEFDRDKIRERFPDTSPQKRLLRPAMLEALVNDVPTSKEEFAFKIPGYLRSATEVEEARAFLGDVLEIIGEFG